MLAIQEETNKASSYTVYKPSHIDWIGDIPEHWALKRIGYVSDLLTGNPWKSEEFSFENGTKILRGENVSEGFLRWGDRTRFWPFPVEVESKFYLKQNDIVIAMDGSKVGKNYVLINESDLPILLHQRMCRVRVKNNYSAKFLEYFVSSEMFRHFIDISKTEPMIPHITQKNIFDFTYSVPPLKEQQAIVNYLDQKTALIDELIGKKQRKIDLLKEQRTALINHAVTKGLNPDVNFKDSGIEWIGEIPEHWEVKKLNYVAKVNSGATPDRSNPNYWDGEIPWIKTGEVDYNVIYSTEEYITDEGYKNSSTKLAPTGTLLMAMYGQGVTRGRVALLGVPATYNQACCAILFSEYVNNKFGFFFFKMAYEYIRDDGNETSQMNISTGYISSLKILAPPISEQQAIVAYLEEQTALVDKAISLETQKIEKLKEYRQSLISAVVTGKISVLPVTQNE